MNKRHLFFAIIMVLMAIATVVAQVPQSFTYQAVVRNSEGKLVSNSTVKVRVSILQGSSKGTAVYSNEYTTNTNAYGLFSIIVGDSANALDVNWAIGQYFLKVEVDPEGGNNYSITSTQQMLSVPYALHAHTADRISSNVYIDEKQVLSISNDTIFLTGGSFVKLPASFIGDYNILINKPTIPTVPTNVSAFANDAGYLTSIIETQVLSISNDTIYLTGGSYAKLPTNFSFNYNDLTNKPTLFSGNYNDLTNKPTIPTIPTNVSAFTNDAGYLTPATITETQVLSISHDTIFLTGGSFVKLPAGFSGNYNDLTNKPTLFSGNYNDLTNKPTIPTIPTNVSAFTNDAGYLTSVTETQTLSDVAAINDSVRSQIKNLYDPTDSMDAINMRTLNAGIKKYPSLINHLGTLVDSIQYPGALLGIFSVSPTQQVRFSKGNLQYSTSEYHATADSTAVGTWRFAEHQYDYLGSDNSNISPINPNWIDLFGWGTSGWDNGNYFYQPYESSNSTSSPYTTSNGYGFGPGNGSSYTNSLTDTNANADWGIFNAISNGGNAPWLWRILTNAEWEYLLNTRSTSSGIRYAKAKVNGVSGIVIVPDNWNSSTYTLNNTNDGTAAYTVNPISLANWSTLENAGCVFLPAAGYRSGTTVNSIDSEGNYWTATYYDNIDAYSLSFDNSLLKTDGIRRYYGRSVRLVQTVTDMTLLPELIKTIPTVTTSAARSIASRQATLGGEVTRDGRSNITTRGVCFNTSPNPTTSNRKAATGAATGTFSGDATGLNPGTTYYARAYATNAQGTAYGNQITFTTNPEPPVVVTACISDVPTTSATGGGRVISDGGATVTARGVCWSSSSIDPDLSSAEGYTTDGTGTGDFTSSIRGLTTGKTYFVRAYATNSAGTSYGKVTALTAGSPIPIIKGVFSISDDQDVYFSPGNLQWTSTGTHNTMSTFKGGSPESGTWRFAEHQWDTIGTDNKYISSSYTGWIDLFGWATSGWDNKNTYYQPYDYRNNSSPSTGYGYGPTDGRSYTYNLINENGYGFDWADWGVYNAISNGGEAPLQWRVLNNKEWVYLLSMRRTRSGYHFAKAIVKDIPGLIVLPNDWDERTYSLDYYDKRDVPFRVNEIRATDWTTLESAGCVFLPAAQYRDDTMVSESSDGRYWSSFYYDESNAYALFFDDRDLPEYLDKKHERYLGFSVRLVMDLYKY